MQVRVVQLQVQFVALSLWSLSVCPGIRGIAPSLALAPIATYVLPVIVGTWPRTVLLPLRFQSTSNLIVVTHLRLLLQMLHWQTLLRASDLTWLHYLYYVLVACSFTVIFLCYHAYCIPLLYSIIVFDFALCFICYLVGHGMSV